jgi:hypothetical protein
MTDVRAELARLRGQIYVPEPTPEPIAPSEKTYSIREVELLIEESEKRLSNTFQQMLAQRRPDHDPTLLAMVMEMKRKIELLDAQVNSDMVPSQRIPDPDSITKLRAQIFHNTGRGVPTRQLKLVVWTCDMAKVSRYKEGTCGNFYVPVYAPGRMARKRLGDALDYLNANHAKLVGCLLDKKYGSKKFADQAVIIMPDDHLYLQLGSERIDCGGMQPAGDDWAPDAPKGTWWWPDNRG